MLAKLDPKMLTAIDQTIGEWFENEERLKVSSGKGIYSLWVTAENHRISRLYCGGDLEEKIKESLKLFNTYHKTSYKRQDVVLIRETPDDTIELQKAQWRIGHLMTTIERMENEIVRLQWDLQQANAKLAQISPAMSKDSLAIAEDILQKINQQLACRHFIHPNEPRMQISPCDRQAILKAYEQPELIEPSVHTDYKGSPMSLVETESATLVETESATLVETGSAPELTVKSI